MARKDGEGLMGRKEKHHGAPLKCNGEKMEVKGWSSKAAVGFLNRR